MNLSGPKVKISRRLGVALTPKASKYLERRPYAPGQHGPTQRQGKQSNYKRQLIEKQKLRAQYNVSERQLRNYYRQATRIPGNTGAALLRLLETRLDALVRTIFAARQYVRHGHVLVNGKRVTMPSRRVTLGEVIAITERSRTNAQIMLAAQAAPRAAPYLEVNAENFSAKLRELPELEQIPVLCTVALVVEYYSR
jgi:small subunit ribosomal protein S4